MNKKIIMGVVVVVVAVAGFFGGVFYQKGKGITAQALQSMSAAQRQQLLQSFRGSAAGGGTFAGAGAAGGRRGAGAGAAGGGFVTGQVLSKDDKSVTIQTMNGSKIVFLSASTTVGKAVAGTLTDVAVGNQVTVTGTPNSDGSVTAQSIQIRPAGSTPPAGQ